MPQPWRLCSTPKDLKHKFVMGQMNIPDKLQTGQARYCLPRKSWNHHKARFFWTPLKRNRLGPNYRSSFSQVAANRAGQDYSIWRLGRPDPERFWSGLSAPRGGGRRGGVG